MNLIGKKVTHKTFGLGTIVGLQTNKVQVDFEFAIKTFVYPDSFESHFQISDTRAQEYIQVKVEEMNHLKAVEQEKVDKLRQNYIVKPKIKANSQAVFGMQENNLKDVIENWTISTGKYLSGSNKGTPRIPKNMNRNSACLLTMRPDGCKEAERIILGIFMAAEDFVGSDCTDGIIPAHEKYRIIWEPEEEDMYFWSYFPNQANLDKWGNTEMKYIPNTVVKKILEDMMRRSSNPEKKDEIYDFYEYFREVNLM